jgi:anti-anti-sigma factor
MSAHVTSPLIKVEHAGNITVFTFTDGEVQDLENTLARELEGNTNTLAGGHLLLDFCRVERIFSVELGTLIDLHKQMKASGGRLTLFNLCDQVYEVFTTCRLHQFLEICREEEQPVGEQDLEE